MVATNQLRQPVFLSTLVWAWAVHHMPMFEGGIHISLVVSVLSYPVALLVAYLAVYKRQVIVSALLLLVTVILAHLYFHLSPPKIAESVFYIAGTGLLYALGLRYMVRLLKDKKKV